MLFLSRHSDYALQSLCYMYGRKTLVTAAEICMELCLPPPFLRTILQKLATEKIITSIKGRGGGFKPLCKPNRLTILRVMECFQDPNELTCCTRRRKPCPRTGFCKLRTVLKKAEKSVLDSFNATTIADLLE